MISIRRNIEEQERFTQSFQALVNVFQGLANAIPKAALPASPELSEQCRAELRRAADRLRNSASRDDIDQAGAATLSQIDDICRSNQMAIQERDEALKDVVATVAGALNGIRGSGETRGTSLTRLADGFESLFSINDAGELRRQLRENVVALRRSVDEMRREGEASVSLLESQVQAFEQRLEAARKGAGKDRLTGLGSRREAERQMQRHMGPGKSPFCVLVFDIEGFRDINARYGTSFGDKLLQALSHTLKARFPEDGALFRWGADEFLAIAEGPIAPKTDLCRSLCAMFAGNRYSTFEGSSRASVSAMLAAGVAQHVPGETVNDLYRRARASLEQTRPGNRP